MKKYTIGIDFGTLSARALLLDAESGSVVASTGEEYPHGVMDKVLPDGTPVPARFALQHPADYLTVLKHTVAAVLEKGRLSPDEIAGVGIDFTTCTLLPMRADGTPLCMEEAYASEPHAYVKLWKHHGAQEEADAIDRVAKARGEEWLANFGGRVSSEWGLPKILETLHKAPDVYADTDRFIEAGDWLSYQLTGEESHAAGFAGFKLLWDAERGYPSNDFLCAVDPRLDGLAGSKISPDVRRVGERAGVLSAKGAELIGLPIGTPLALPILDGHAALPALGITEPGAMMLITGTSGVEILHAKEKRRVPGSGGFVYESSVTGLYTYEAGQSGLGDGFDWFVRSCVPESYTAAARKEGKSIHQYLRERASRLRVGESGLLALDWLGGNRSVLQNSDLSCMILGLTVSTRPEEIWRALIEATAFGVRKVIETYTDHGLGIDRIRASGGIAKKDPLLMQIYADVTGREIEVLDTEQGAAHGSAIYAAVASGLCPDLHTAAETLSVKEGITYIPDLENKSIYDKLYTEYTTLHDYFGRGGNDVMLRLRRMGE